MAKFCANCGNQMMDNAVVCPACGAPAEAPAAAPAPAAKSVKDAVKKIDPKVLKLGGIAVAAIAVIAIIIAIIAGGNSPKKALNNYFDYAWKTNVKKVESLAPKAYWNFCKESGLVDVKDKDEVKECNEEYLEKEKEDLEDNFGEKIKYSYKITKEKDLSTKKLNAIKDVLKEAYNIPKKDVKAAKEIDLEYKLSGKEDVEEDEIEGIIVVKIGGSWYVLVEDSRFGYGFGDYDSEYDWEAYAEYKAEKAKEDEDDE